MARFVFALIFATCVASTMALSLKSPAKNEKEAKQLVNERVGEVLKETMSNPDLSPDYKDCVQKKFSNGKTGFAPYLSKFVQTGVKGIGLTAQNLALGVADSLQGLQRGGLLGDKGFFPSLADNIEFVLEGELDDCSRKHPSPKK